MEAMNEEVKLVSLPASGGREEQRGGSEEPSHLHLQPLSRW